MKYLRIAAPKQVALQLFDQYIKVVPYQVVNFGTISFSCETFKKYCTDSSFLNLIDKVLKYVRFAIVIRNGKIVFKVVWIEDYLRLNLSSQKC